MNESDWYTSEINFVPNIPKTYETKCPICKRPIRLMDCSERLDYWKDIAEAYKKQLDSATEEFKKIDEWCVKNIGDTFTFDKWRKFKEILREKYGK